MTPIYCPKCMATQPQRRRFAFTAIIPSREDIPKLSGAGWIIGQADEGTRGYSPVRSEGVFGTEKEARERAKEMNKEVGWANESDAQMMVLTTMPMKEEHLAGLLGEAVNYLRRIISHDQYVDTGDVERFIDEDCKGYAKEPA